MKGFTLIEVIVAFAIVFIVITMILTIATRCNKGQSDYVPRSSMTEGSYHGAQPRCPHCGQLVPLEKAN